MGTYSENGPISEQTTENKHNLFAISFEDKSMLYRQYMPFIQQGGLFVATREQFNLGDEVFVSLQLPDEHEQHQLSGRVVWMTPPAAERGLPAGIGVQFIGDEAVSVRSKIEGQLVSMLDSQQGTDTM